MIVKIDKGLILETVSLLEEELSPMAKRAMKVGALGAGIGLAHAGTFGTGIKNMVDSAGSAIAGGAQTMSHHIGNSLTDAGKFYGYKDTPSNANIHQEKMNNRTEIDSHKVKGSEDSDDSSFLDDESGLGILSGAGAAALAAGAGYAGLKGISKTKAGKKFKEDFKMGARGGSVSNPGIAHKLGKGLRASKQKLNNSLNSLNNLRRK